MAWLGLGMQVQLLPPLSSSGPGTHIMSDWAKWDQTQWESHGKGKEGTNDSCLKGGEKHKVCAC